MQAPRLDPRPVTSSTELPQDSNVPISASAVIRTADADQQFASADLPKRHKIRRKHVSDSQSARVVGPTLVLLDGDATPHGKIPQTITTSPDSPQQ